MKIVDLVSESSNSSSIVVVTDYKGICRNITRIGAKIMPTKELYNWLFSRGLKSNMQAESENKPEQSDDNTDTNIKRWLKK
jgi:hypothetical protein